MPNANGAGVELYDTDLKGAAVVENELSKLNGAGVDGPKLLAPNENIDGLEKGKLAFSEADPPRLLPVMESDFSLLLSLSANAVDTTRSPRKAA